MKPNEVRRALFAHADVVIKSQRHDGSFVACDKNTGVRVACCEKIDGNWSLKLYPYIDFEVVGCVGVRKAEFASIPMEKKYETILSERGVIENGVAKVFAIDSLDATTIASYVGAVVDAQEAQYMTYIENLFEKYPEDQQDALRIFAMTFMQCESAFKNDIDQGYILRYKQYLYKLLRTTEENAEVYAIYGGGFKPIGFITYKEGKLTCNFMTEDGEVILDKTVGAADSASFADRDSRICGLFDCFVALDDKIASMEPKG